MGIEEISDKTIWFIVDGKEVSYNARRRVRNLINRITNKKISKNIVSEVSNCLESILTKNCGRLNYEDKEFVKSFYGKFPGFSRIYRENKETIDKLIKESKSDENLLYGLAAVKEHRSETFWHAIRTYPLMMTFYVYLNKGGENLNFRINDVKGAYYHCFAKPTIPKEIFDKEELDPVQRDIMKEHAINSCAVIKNWIPEPEKNIPYIMVLQHHENEDGTGYPRRIKGDEIHKSTKMFKVIDVYDAITNPRIYRGGKAYPHETALNYIKVFSIENKEERANNITLYSKEDKEFRELVRGRGNKHLFDDHIAQRFISFIEKLRS